MFEIKLSNPNLEPEPLMLVDFRKIFVPHIRRKVLADVEPYLDDAANTILQIRSANGNWVAIASGDVEGFHKWLSAFMKKATNRSALLLIEQIEQVKPEANFAPPNVVQKALDASFHFRSTLADICFKHDLSDTKALVMFRKEKNVPWADLLPKDRFPSTKRLAGGWFAFETTEEAVIAKMSVSRESFVFEL